MGGVVISNSWLEAMHHPDSLMIGTITALYDVGAVFGALGAAFTAERLGRKIGLIFGTVILLIGTILIVSAFGRAQFMVARIFTGLGIGYITSITPVYNAGG